MDVMKRLDDLMNMALDERTQEKERLNSALGALRLIREYKLLGKKHVDVAVDILDRFTSQDFVENVVARGEKIADGIDRAMGIAKRVSGAIARGSSSVSEDRSGRRRRSRRY